MEPSLKNLKIISKISHEITSTLDLNEVMILTYENIKEVMDVSYFFITSYIEVEQAVQIKFSVKEGKIIKDNHKTLLNNPQSLSAFAIKGKKEIIIHDFELEYAKYIEEFPKLREEDLYTRSVIHIPLLFKDKIIGLFSVQSIKKNAYSMMDIEMLRSLSNVIAIALNNADQYNQLNVANLEILNQKKIVEEQKYLLEKKNEELKNSQEKLIQQEKMAAFGVMASRVSHEIQNPLNFVNNFSELSQEMVIDVIKSVNEEDKKLNAEVLICNLKKINEHGKRVATIVKQLQEHSTKGTAHKFFEGNQL